MGDGLPAELLVAGVAHRLRLLSDGDWTAVAARNDRHWKLARADVRVLPPLRTAPFSNGNLIDGGDVVVAISMNKAFMCQTVHSA